MEGEGQEEATHPSSSSVHSDWQVEPSSLVVGLLPLSQSPTQETLPPHLGDTEKKKTKQKTKPNQTNKKNTLHQQGLDEAVVELADMPIQVPRLCESALTPAAGVGLLPCVNHRMPA